MMAQRVAINNLADSYMAFNTNYHDTGLFGFYATADPKHQAVDDLVCSASASSVASQHSRPQSSICFLHVHCGHDMLRLP